mgnify:FL=1|tara:strand:+ start:5791 stop:5964 length:174 start_codon:yes stop_codon:yes gene_type:complete
MFNLFNKKSKIEKLDSEYKKLMNKAFVLSTKNRRLSDEAISKANDIQKTILKLQADK